MRRHNPYVGTTWHAPASPIVFSSTSPRSASPTVLPRRKSSQHLGDDDDHKDMWWSLSSNSPRLKENMNGTGSPTTPTLSPSSIDKLHMLKPASPPFVSAAYPAPPRLREGPKNEVNFADNLKDATTRTKDKKAAKENGSKSKERPCSQIDGDPFLPLQLKDGLSNEYGLGKSPFDTCIF